MEIEWLKSQAIEAGESWCDYCSNGGWVQPVNENAPPGERYAARAIPCPKCNQRTIKDGPTSYTFSNFKPYGHDNCQCLYNAFDAAQRFSQGDGSALWVVLNGPNGCGKTHLLTAAMSILNRAGKYCLLRHATNLGDEMLRSISNEKRRDDGDLAAGAGVEETMQIYESTDYLMIDDFGAKGLTPWVSERMERLLNRRYSPVLPTMITMNMDIKDLPTAIASRMKDASVCEIVHLCSSDYRLRKTR